MNRRLFIDTIFVITFFVIISTAYVNQVNIFYPISLNDLFTSIFLKIFGEHFAKAQLIFAQASILIFVFFSEKFIEIENIDKLGRKLLLILKSAIILNLVLILFWFTAGHRIYNVIVVLYCILMVYIIVKNKKWNLFYNKIFIIGILGILALNVLYILFNFGLVNSLHLSKSGAKYDIWLMLLLFLVVFIIKLIEKKSDLIRELQEKVDEISAIYTKQQVEIQAHADSLRDASNKLIEIVELKEGLTSMIVHDLKIPLHNIINCPEEFESGKQLHMIKQSGKNMLNLVNNILDVYKYEKTGLTLDQQNINVNALINSVYEQVELLASQKNVSICFNIPSNLDIFADYGIIERVFVNLLTNAIKYTPANGMIIVDYNKNKDEEYQFEVIDSGPGIPKEKKDLVFVKFGQILAKKTGEIRSTGLGLTFCKIAVEAHNGKIGFENLEPLGTKFWFSIPSVKFDNFASQTTKTVLATDRAEDYIKKITLESRKYLKPYISILKDIEIYHISRIRQVLKNIEEINTDIQIWKDLITDAVYSNNQQLYQYLLQLDN